MEALPFRLRKKLVRRTRYTLLGIVARHLDVAAEGQRANAVFRLPSLHAENSRIEAELKLQHPNPDALGGKKMPELVHEDEDAENERKRKKREQCCGH